jgi:uncharacterized protein (DUF1697 family)
MKPAQAVTYLALLRGINVGGKNKLAMNHLAELFSEAGCIDVHTYLQSGNIIFDASPSLAKTVPARVTHEIEERFGLRIPVILRTTEEMIETTRNNPFLTNGDEKLLYVFFLADLPKSKDVANLDPERSPPDSFHVYKREIYLRLANGAGRTKLTNAYFDAKLATTSTARNWRTVLALTRLMNERLRNPATEILRHNNI